MLQLTNPKQDSYQLFLYLRKIMYINIIYTFLLDFKKDQNLNYNFCHNDQNIFHKLSHIIWKENKYEIIVNRMGGFHIFLVTLNVLYKKYNLMGLKEWWLTSKIIAAGSVDQAMEGRHYFRAVRLHKQSIESLLRYKSEKEIHVLPTGVY